MKVVHVHAKQAQRKDRLIVLRILYPLARRGWVVNATLRGYYPWEWDPKQDAV